MPKVKYNTFTPRLVKHLIHLSKLAKQEGLADAAARLDSLAMELGLADLTQLAKQAGIDPKN